MIRFTKMHGIGNDYIYVDGFDAVTMAAIDDPAALAVAMADRHTGVGGDGMILILPPDDPRTADIRMRMFNADGSEAEMCGNGIRCVCKYAHDYGLSDANPMRIETGAGVLSLAHEVDDEGLVRLVTVDMGEPILDLPAIPVDEGRLAGGSRSHHRLDFDDAAWFGVFVSMGNPHVVLFRDENEEMMPEALDDLDIARWGPRIEGHPAFPRRINAHFVHVQSHRELTMRTWERGSGITRACGTGACAVCVAGAITGRTDREVLVHLPGGDLVLRWDETTNHVFMTGPAVEVFSGQWPVEAMSHAP